MPFGRSGAPVSFQRLMDKVCCGLPFVTTYLDDVLVYSATVQEHQQHLELLFQRLPQLVSPSEAKNAILGCPRLYILVTDSRQMAWSQTHRKWLHAVCAWPTPTNVSDLKSFLGLASYYRHYIPQFADVHCEPIPSVNGQGCTICMRCCLLSCVRSTEE